MKWRKHQSKFKQDPEVQIYLDLCRDRLVGYGFLISVMDVISEQMGPKNPDPTCTLSPSHWRRACEVPANRWAVLCKHLASSELATFEDVEGKLRVTVPRLREFTDDYTRKIRTQSGQGAESVRTPIGTEERRKKKEERLLERGYQDSSIEPAPNDDSPPADSYEVELLLDSSSVHAPDGAWRLL